MRVSQQSAGKISWVEFSADSRWGGCWGLAGGGVTFSAVSCTPGLTVAGSVDSIVWVMGQESSITRNLVCNASI